MPRAVTCGPPWTQTDDQQLAKLWGTRGIETLARTFGRTPCAIAKRARFLKLGPAFRRAITIRQLEKKTGYCRERLFAAAARLGLRLKRAPRMSEVKPRTHNEHHRRILVTKRQAAKISAFLAAIPDVKALWSNTTKRTTRDAWGTGGKPPACRKCKKKDKPHTAKGLCCGCYKRPSRIKARRCTSKRRKKKSTRRISSIRGCVDIATGLVV